MRHRIFVLTVLCMLFCAATALAAEKAELRTQPSDAVSEGGPSAFLVSDKFEFEPVFDGAAVIHEFVLQNKGTAPLKIEKVRTG